MNTKSEITEDMVKTTSLSPCERVFKVGDYTLRLFIICNGAPALSFENYALRESYPVTTLYSNENWDKKLGKYVHQDSLADGPGFDVLPDGLNTVKKYLEINIPRYELRQKRYKEVEGLLTRAGVLHRDGSFDSVVSHKKMDKSTRTMFQCHYSISYGYILRVICRTAYSASGLKNFEREASQWWKDLDKLTQDFKPSHDTWEDLTENQYQALLDMFRKGIDSKEMKRAKA